MGTSVPIGDADTGIFLRKPSQADTMGNVLADLNANTDALASMPLPYRFVQYQTRLGGVINGVMYSNGWAELSGHITFGRGEMLCNSQQPNDHGFLSDNFEVEYPFAFVEPPSCVTSKNVYPWTDIQLYNQVNGRDKYVGRFWCSADDSQAENVKEVSLKISGWWR